NKAGDANCQQHKQQSLRHLHLRDWPLRSDVNLPVRVARRVRPQTRSRISQRESTAVSKTHTGTGGAVRGAALLRHERSARVPMNAANACATKENCRPRRAEWTSGD